MRCRCKKVSVIFLLCCTLMSGCGANGKQDQEHYLASGGISQGGNQLESDGLIGSTQSGSYDSASTEVPPRTKEVKIYTIDREATLDKTVSVAENEEITPQLIVKLVVSDIEDKSYVIKVNEVLTEVIDDGTYTVVDFDASAPPVLDVGEGTETAILDAIAFSILDNMPDCSGVIYRVDGQAYKSSYHSYDYNRVYAHP